MISESSQSRQKKQASANLKIASYQIPPPGQVHLPPEDKSPLVPPQQRQGQPSTVATGGSHTLSPTATQAQIQIPVTIKHTPLLAEPQLIQL